MRLLVVFSSLVFLAAGSGCNCGPRAGYSRTRLEVQPAALDFGVLAPGEVSERSLLLFSESTASLALLEVTLSGNERGAFSVSTPLATLRPQEETHVVVRYVAPASSGVDTAVITFHTDSAMTPEVLVSVVALVAPEAPALDAGVDDAGTEQVDAGSPPDAGAPDAGAPDASVPDASVPDAGVPDAGVPDAGAPDAGCRPRTCSEAGASCGTPPDGCGERLECGACSGTQVCGGGGLPYACGTPASLGATCGLRFPPDAGAPCAVPETSATFYLDPSFGDDARDGASPAAAWRTLAHAVTAVPDGGTVRVSEGVDSSPVVVIARPIVLKGGFDATFATWDPDRYRSTVTGRVVMSHDGAVLGGFHLQRRTADRGGLFVSAGTWVRNLIELQLLPSPLGTIPGAHTTYYGLVAAAAAGRRVVLRCNDLTARIEGTGAAYISTPMLTGIALGNLQLHNGHTTLDANRVCLDAPVGTPSLNDVVLGGYGSCLEGTPASVLLTNNIFEGRAAQTTAVHFTGCNAPLSVVATNNTTFTTSAGFGGSSTVKSPVDWALVNNVLGRVTAGAGRAVSLGAAPTELSRLEGNLAFGWADPQPIPAPLVASSNDLGAAVSWAQVFVAPSTGDFRPLASGPATQGALNVFGEAASGDVRGDLLQQPRPSTGAWVRGALLP